MGAVCESAFFAERIEANPANRQRLMAMEPAQFISVMELWRQFFTDGAELPVIGATEAELRSLKVPTCIVPGFDDIHPQAVGENLDTLLPSSELHYLYTVEERKSLPQTPTPQSNRERQGRLARVFTDFLAGVTTAV